MDMKLADYVVEFLAEKGIYHNFVVSGGAVIHLIDSTAKNPKMSYICAQHEQNGAAAADMYARVSGNLGLTMTTSGPGATNIVTSVCNAYFDSIPMLCITGQVSRFRLRKNKNLRQKGFQETDLVSIFSSITKYAKLVLDPLEIRYELEKAIYLAKKGRPGPILLDIPDDLQRVEIDPGLLRPYIPEPEEIPSLTGEIQTLLQMIAKSERPVLIYGAGVHCAKAEHEAIAFARRHKIPVVLTWGATDLLIHSDELNMKGIGVCGPRSGNFAVQFSDLVIAMGTRLSPMITGGKQDLFAPKAKKVMIDVDIEELSKFDPETFILDLPIQSDLQHFFLEMKTHVHEEIPDRFQSWRSLIRSWERRYPICPSHYFSASSRINPYVFIKELSHLCKEGDILISDTGANVSWTMQAFETKANQRLYSAWNHTPMGYSLPASIGASLALNNKEIICIIGDGGLMMCLQELGTIRRHNLPIKIFLFNNKGHGIQKQTIDTWLNSHYVAVDEESGLYFPNYCQIAQGFNIPYFKMSTHSFLKDKIDEVLKHKGPIFCDVELIENQKIVPMLKFGSGLQNLAPNIPQEELDSIEREAGQLSNNCKKCFT